jgi:hypothetical protein
MTESAAKNSRLAAGRKNSATNPRAKPASRSRRSVTMIPIHTNGNATASIVP